MLLSDLLCDFLGYCKVERGMTKTTLVTYGSRLRHFLRWTVEQGEPAATHLDFNTDLLRRYQYSVSATGVRPRTVRSKIIALRSWGTFLAQKGTITENFALCLTMPKKDAPRRDNVSDEEATALLVASERIGNLRRSRMAKAMMSVLVYGALRRQELLDLRLDDVDLSQGAIIIRQGKGQKSRTVWPHHECITAIRAWLSVRGEAQQNWMWPFDSRRPLGDIGLKSLFDETKAIAGLQDHSNIHPHAMRRVCATRMLQQGADISTVQALLGHADLATTAMYLVTDEKRLRLLSNLGGLFPTGAEPAIPAPIVTAPAQAEPEQHSQGPVRSQMNAPPRRAVSSQRHRKAIARSGR